MSNVYTIRRGKDIQLEGVPANQVLGTAIGSTVAVKPNDFKGIKPKLEVKSGDEVKAGDVLFHDKNRPEIKFTSPVSGEVAEIVRGDRRAILEIRVLADKEIKHKAFDTNADIKSLLLESGLWVGITQRPYGTIANPEDRPKAIHISTFDSAPLAQDNYFIAEGEEANFAKGVEALKKLTDGDVHLNHKHGSTNAGFTSVANAVHNEFKGPHPAGLPGIQIHHIDAINKGEVVWTLTVQTVIYIGRLLNGGKVDMRKRVALSGSEITESGYVETISGTAINALIDGRTTSGNNRIISGNVLTGENIGANGYLGFFDNVVTVIPEGDQYEFMGWLIPTYPRPTISNSFPIFKYLKKRFKVNTNLHGEERAFVVTGQYEKVLPMDIMPVQLLKAILAQDLEAMENLGIYEVIEEDLALCEFVCTSKINVQNIVRDGLTLMESEG
ncbi:MAG: Na(+)-translocating NADH-quinone reductase subunit A [Bacteroidetes bacterium]|nr:Na(+)-translocating NADH-quinone reductase subunit A [Bacteroidota bacterium]